MLIVCFEISLNLMKHLLNFMKYLMLAFLIFIGASTLSCKPEKKSAFGIGEDKSLPSDIPLSKEFRTSVNDTINVELIESNQLILDLFEAFDLTDVDEEKITLLSKLSWQIGPADFEGFVLRLQELNLNQAQSVHLLELAIASVGDNGGHSVVEEFVFENYGAGEIRQRFLQQVYGHSTLSLSDLKNKITQLPFDEDRDSALLGVANLFKNRNKTVWSELQEWLPAFSSAGSLFHLGLSLAGGIAWIGEPNQAFDTEFLLSADELVSEVVYSTDDEAIVATLLSPLIQISRPHQSFELWELFDEKTLVEKPFFQDNRDLLIDKMISLDPIKAMQVTLANEKTPESVKTAMSSWLKQNSDVASHWLLDNLDFLETVQSDQAISAVVEYAIEHRETDGAVEWIKQISNEPLQKELEKKLEETKVK